MKRIFILMALCAIMLGIVSCSNENSSAVLTSPTPGALTTGSAQSFSDYGGVAAPEVSNAAVAQLPSSVHGNIGFYGSQQELASVCPDFFKANFENSRLPSGSVRVCTGVLNSNTNNECYAPGTIPEGIALYCNFGEQLAVLTAGVLGMPSTVVGPNFFAADLNMVLNPGVRLVAMNLFNPFGPATLDVEVYGPNGVLLAIIPGVMTGTTIPSFFGLRVIDTPSITITRLRFVQTGGSGGELVDNVIYSASCD